MAFMALLSSPVHADETESEFDETDSSADDSVKSVETDLKDREEYQPSLLGFDFAHSESLAPVYDIKDTIEDSLRLKIGVDYTTLTQYSTFTKSGDDVGFSQVFRILGTWKPFEMPKSSPGALVWKMETRSSLGGNPAPRDMGFDTGTALSTANFKELRYWGVTDLYWRQRFWDGQAGFLVGHMDPGDWADQYPLLNAWTSFMNDAFYNNPTEAIPKRGFGVVGQVFSENNLYLMAGIHDANGGDGKLNPGSFFDGEEYFSWAEFGSRGGFEVSRRHNTHAHFWHQDALQAAGTEESWGGIFTHSYLTRDDAVFFVRAGLSEGDAPQLRRFIGAGFSVQPRERDTFGLATSWGSPPDKSLRDQITSEMFYRIQVTKNFSVSPDLQLIFRPSFTDQRDWLFIPGLRARMVF